MFDDDLEAGEDGEKPASLLSSLLTSRASELNDMEEDDLVKEVRKVYEKLWNNTTRKYECRVVDGSYTVTSTFENDVDLPRMHLHRGSAKKEEEHKDGPPRATQRIDTVASASPIAKLFGRTFKSIYTRGHAMKTESKVIIDDVNIRLEAGKMYLVLGLPGSGKSSLLKIIANTLRQDSSNIVGGKVSINGISPDDKGVIWSVRINGLGSTCSRVNSSAYSIC